MHDAVGIGIDELSKAIRRVVRPDEAAFNTGRAPLGEDRIGVGDVDVDDATGLAGVGFVVLDEVHLHTAAFGEAVVRGFVQLRRKTESRIASKRSIEVTHADDGSDALEGHLSHNRKGMRRPEAHDAVCVVTATVPPMVLELAILDVRPGETDAFEHAFAEAKEIISTMRGFEHLQLRRCIEDPKRYVLLVEWERLEDHTEGFRQSGEYQRWRALLHRFYDPFPTVEHYDLVVSVGERA